MGFSQRHDSSIIKKEKEEEIRKLNRRRFPDNATPIPEVPLRMECWDHTSQNKYKQLLAPHDNPTHLSNHSNNRVLASGYHSTPHGRVLVSLVAAAAGLACG